MLPEEIKIKIERRFGKHILYPKDCDALSESIQKAVNERISPSTLKRIFGIDKDFRNPRQFTLDVLAAYVGSKDWNILTEDIEKQNTSADQPVIKPASQPKNTYGLANDEKRSGFMLIRKKSNYIYLLIILLIFGSSALMFFYVVDAKTTQKPDAITVENTTAPYKPGYYVLIGADKRKVYVYEKPDDKTQASAYFSIQIRVYIEKIQDRFGYLTYINSRGTKSEGWVDMRYLRYKLYHPDNKVFLSNGLIAFYPFNGNANDDSGNGYNASVYGATLTADRFGNANSAYSFDGISNYISAGNINLIKTATISVWVYPVKPNGTDPVGLNDIYSASIIDKNKDASNDSGYGLYYCNKLNIGLYAQVGWTADATRNCIYPTPTKNLVLNQWNHCLFTYNNGTGQLFLNGKLIYAKSGLNPIAQNNDVLLFGKAPWGGNIFQGKLDDIRIYNRVLNQLEITYLASN